LEPCVMEIRVQVENLGDLHRIEKSMSACFGQEPPFGARPVSSLTTYVHIRDMVV
jgi:hypothetical protein